MINAVIFDLDGTVLDNEQKWEDSFQVVARNNSQKWIHEPGIGILPNWEKIVGKGEKAVEMTRETEEEYHKTPESLVMNGLEDLVEAIKEKGWLTGLATGSNWNVVEEELEQLNLWLAFDVTTTGEEVLAQKPDPEIYLLTAQKLGVDPANCVVVEDSVAGVESAVAAGMKVIGLTSDYASADMLKKAGAKDVVDSLTEVVVLLRKYGEESKNSDAEN